MSVKSKEKLAFLLMSDGEDAKRFLLFLVYATIKKNNSITINQLCNLMEKTFFLPRDKVEQAVAVLTNSQLFDSVSTYEEKQGVVHLRCKNSDSLSEWIKDFCSKIPEACELEPPLYVNRNRRLHDSTA